MELDSYSLLDARIAQREHEESSRGLLSEGIYSLTHLISRSDETSLDNLRELRQRAAKGDKSVDAVEALNKDNSAVDWRDETVHYSAEFLKIAPLFMGKAGYAVSGAVNGLDEVKLDSSPEMQALDFTLGAAKGVAMKWGMDRVGASSLNAFGKGALLGGGNGLLQSALSSSNWYDQKSGQWHLQDGFVNTAESTGLGAGLGAVTFPLGARLGEFTSSLGAKYVDSSVSKPLVSAVTTGFSFGATSGATVEALREVSSGEEISPSKIAVRGLADGIVGAAAAGTGYKAGELYVNSSQAHSNIASESVADIAPSKSEQFTPDSKVSDPRISELKTTDDTRISEFKTEGDRLQWLTEQPAQILDLASKLSSGEDVSDQLLQTIKDHPELAKSITPEQTKNFLDTVLVSNDPVRGLDFLVQSGAMKYVVPEIDELNGPRGAQDSKWHPEGNVWVHLKMVMTEQLTRVKDLPEAQKRQEMLATLLHDISKPETQKIWPNGGISNHLHAEKGAVKSAEILQRLGYDQQTTDMVSEVVRDHMKMHQMLTMNPKGVETILSRPYIEAKIRLQASDSLGTTFEGRFDTNLEPYLTERLSQFQEAKTARDAALNLEKPLKLFSGDDLLAAGVPRGPLVGDILNAVGQQKLQSRAEIEEWLKLNHQITLKPAPVNSQ